jgi:hypothetical protein
MNLSIAASLVLGLLFYASAGFQGVSASPQSTSRPSNDNGKSLQLSTWMDTFMPVIGNLSLLDLTLPGTHDTLTYDLSQRISNAGIGAGMEEVVSLILHYQSWIEQTALGEFIRTQAQTQRLNITQQLNAGVRFIDFRVMWTSVGTVHNATFNWYSLHMVQSNQVAVQYFKEIRQWMNEHPTEVLVIYLSRHGNADATGQDQYPITSVATKQAFWAEIVSVFDGLILNTTQSSMNSTSIATLLKREHRVTFIVSDYAEFSGSSELAYDAHKHLFNTGAGGEEHEAAQYQVQQQVFERANADKDAYKKNNTFYLLSLAASAPAAQVEQAAWLTLLKGRDTKKHSQACAQAFEIPGMQECQLDECWCPLSLLEVGQLSNFYVQLTLEAAVSNEGWGFPHAIYLDGMDADGSIRTSSTADPNIAGYAYTPTLLLSNLQRFCSNGQQESVCDPLVTLVEALRQESPVQQWNDPLHGRNSDWPQNTTHTSKGEHD